MSIASPHSKLVTAAARKVLGPMGLVQKGRSRTWLDDHGWWIGVVEFQPSGWARGSYLNVGCMWLWDAQDYISFDVGGRVEPFRKFRDESQFEGLANALAEGAAKEVVRYRRQFLSVRDVSAYYLSKPRGGFWSSFHAAVACALTGRAEGATRLFRQIAEPDEDRSDWVLRARADAMHLAAILDDTKRFRDTVVDRIKQSRKLQKLPALTAIDFGV